MSLALFHRPAPLEPVGVARRGRAPRLRRGEPFGLLSWNLQFAASRRYFFFYDGGPDVHADPRVVRMTLDAMGALLSTEGPDILFLQEVDRDSQRTGRIDELAHLSSRLALPCWASTPYHRCRFVPAPLLNPLGRVDLHLATGSVFEMGWARRRALPLLNEPWWRRAFNLQRAVLEVALPLAGEKTPLVLLNTHLSAFSYGDGTLTRQVAVLLERLSFLDRRQIPWILAGDFNLLPPWDDPGRLGREATQYVDRTHPLIPLFRRYQSGLDSGAEEPWRHYTYLPFGAERPDRRLDYLFVSDGVELLGHRVIPEDPPSSDHLPLVARAVVRPAP